LPDPRLEHLVRMEAGIFLQHRASSPGMRAGGTLR
jgi:hypothetical protein